MDRLGVRWKFGPLSLSIPSLSVLRNRGDVPSPHAGGLVVKQGTR